MKFNLEKSSGIRIHAYDPGIVTVALPSQLKCPKMAETDADEPSLCRISDNIIISSEAIHLHEAPASYDKLEQQHVDFALRFNPEIILLGTGDHLHFPAPQLISLAANQGVGIEVMDTAAACRTFNILVGESRQVVAILLMN